MNGLALRPPDTVMKLDRMGSFHQTRLSFVRSLLRKVMGEQWQIARSVWELDGDGYGCCVYSVLAPFEETYSVVIFSNPLSEENRTDRVIAEAWDVAFVLCEGVVDDGQIAELQENVPLQEAGRYLPYVLVLSRANKSTRNFEHLLDCLVNGRQPDRAQLAKVGYLYRTTAVYGNGKFGIADYAKLAQTQAFGETFRAQMFAVWVLRQFALEQLDFLAKQRNRDAAELDPEIARYLGVGNATGLGMAPFLVTHPRLIHQWISVRETAIARVLAWGVVSDLARARFGVLLGRATQHVREITTIHERQQAKNEKMLLELVQTAAFRFDTWQQLVGQTAAMSDETQEMLYAILLELHPFLVDELAEGLSADEDEDLRPMMSVAQLITLIEREYAWALAIDYTERETAHWFWYRSAEKEEPRLGNRWEEMGAEKEQALDVGRSVAQLHTLLTLFHHPEATVIDFLLHYPKWRGIVRRVQMIETAPYGEIRDNLIGRTCLPIDLLRCKLSFFGASKFDPRSNLWVRITLFQGAPLLTDVGRPFADDWFLPVVKKLES